MTKASLSALDQGHGLIDNITDQHYAAFNRGEPIRDVVCIAVLRPTGIASRVTKDGRHNVVQYTVSKIEVITDPNQANDLRYSIQALYEARTTPGREHALPLGLPGFDDEEKRKALIERIEDWAEENGLTGAELDTEWRNHFGIGAGEENSWGDRGVPSEYGRSPLTWLLEFALDKGAVDQEKKDEAPPVVFSNGQDASEETDPAAAADEAAGTDDEDDDSEAGAE
jgi:hypothetical protein